MKNENEALIVALLQRWNGGDHKVLPQLGELSYATTLLPMARNLLRGDRLAKQLEPAELVSETWVKLKNLPDHFDSAADFFALIRHKMLQRLQDLARKQNVQKRDGRAIKIPMEQCDRWMNT